MTGTTNKRAEIVWTQTLGRSKDHYNTIKSQHDTNCKSGMDRSCCKMWEVEKQVSHPGTGPASAPEPISYHRVSQVGAQEKILTWVELTYRDLHVSWVLVFMVIPKMLIWECKLLWRLSCVTASLLFLILPFRIKAIKWVGVCSRNPRRRRWCGWNMVGTGMARVLFWFVCWPVTDSTLKQHNCSVSGQAMSSLDWYLHGLNRGIASTVADEWVLTPMRKHQILGLTRRSSAWCSQFSVSTNDVFKAKCLPALSCTFTVTAVAKIRLLCLGASTVNGLRSIYRPHVAMNDLWSSYLVQMK